MFIVSRSWLFVVVVVVVIPSLLIPDLAFAHTRERKRLDELDIDLAKSRATVDLRIKGIEESQSQASARLEERQEHSRRLGKRVDLLQEDVKQGLFSLRDTLAKRIDGQLKKIAASSAVAGKQRDALRGDVAGLTKAIKEFKQSLEAYAKTVDKRLATVERDLTSFSAHQVADRRAVDKRFQVLLKAVDEENAKVRRTLTTLGRRSAVGEARSHEVQVGENLWGISRTYGLTFDQLKEANPRFKRPDAVIHPGETLVIPAL